MLKYRILKTLIYSCFLLFVVKTFEIYQMHEKFSDIFLGVKAVAQEANSKNDKKADKSKKKEEPKGKVAELDANGEVKPQISVDEIKSLSDSEIEILQRLSQNRDKLLKWEEDLKIKENVLRVTEERIDKKLEQLRMLKKEVEKSLTEYRKQEEQKTLSLVKIYENMKSKNAADILSKMEVDEIVPLIDKMKEKNAAEILAKMDPKSAKEVTTKLNRIGKLENPEYK
jgi:flagellar motility protein MotE (MotC chaperone)